MENTYIAQSSAKAHFYPTDEDVFVLIQQFRCLYIASIWMESFCSPHYCFGVFIARRFLAAANPNASISALVNDFILTYGEQKSLFREYYSDGLLMSWKARQMWMAPDLKPLC